MPELFGTDGVRAVANTPPLTPQQVTALGFAAGQWYRSRGENGTVLVGRDTRLSGPMLEAALVAGLTSSGLRVELAGVIPTPAVSWLVRELGALGGAVISASHNPFEDNGVKFFRADGSKLAESEEDQIEALLRQDPLPGQALVTGSRIGTCGPIRKPLDLYLAHAVSTLAGDRPLAGLRIVCDCANGAAARTTPAALRRLGAKVTALNIRPNGVNINRGCGSLHFEVLAAAVRRRPGNLGITHDGDADRVLMCDESGGLVDGDRMLGLLGRWLAPRELLPGRKVVATIMANAGLDEALEPLGITVVRAQVGDRRVHDEMLRHGATLGGEPSGHIILRELGPTGDGLLTALAVLRVMREEGATLADLAGVVRLYPTYAGAVRVSRKPPLDSLEPVARAIDDARHGVAPRGRVVVRYSGTEPVARVLVEGPDEALVRRLGQAIEASLRASLGT
ncbi:MAG: phosphoglucosamine mutase [Candidatus Riflebacteria bacterium]|nr:phosphoglucosamine mutase [Candidatus Riflebacteria bacterium]